MNQPLKLIHLPLLAVLLAPAAFAESLYTQQGSDPSFASVQASSGGKPGDRFNKGGALGSRIQVNQALLEQQAGKLGPIPKDLGLHTEFSGGINRKEFSLWTRWYQEDGNVQIFRLFKGEQNIRGGEAKDGSPGRVEIFTHNLNAGAGSWREWEGTYTILQPVRGCIFQLFHEGSLWPFHLEMSEKGDLYFLRRHPTPGLEREISLAKDMVGKSLSVKVRANGEEYEVYQKAPLDSGPWKLAAKGTGPKAKGNKISFRWGIYCGSKKGQTVPSDGLMFVTGVTIR